MAVKPREQRQQCLLLLGEQRAQVFGECQETQGVEKNENLSNKCSQYPKARPSGAELCGCSPGKRRKQ